MLLADKLSEHFKLTTNGTSGSAARRNKYLMGEKVRAAGLRAVAQVQATKWSQVESFVKKELVPMLKGGDFKVIVKPVESAGSDDVTLCRSMDEVRAAFGSIRARSTVWGSRTRPRWCRSTWTARSTSWIRSAATV